MRVEVTSPALVVGGLRVLCLGGGRRTGVVRGFG
jgi:hypothetical protein